MTEDRKKLKLSAHVKRKRNKTVSKLFESIFFQPEQNARPWNLLAVSANHCRYPLFERQTRGGAGRWRLRDVVVVSAGYNSAHRRTQDFTMGEFTWWGPGQVVWGRKSSSGVLGQSPGRGSDGRRNPQKLKQNGKLAYNFQRFSRQNLGFNEYRSGAWTVYFANTLFKEILNTLTLLGAPVIARYCKMWLFGVTTKVTRYIPPKVTPSVASYFLPKLVTHMISILLTKVWLTAS